MKRELYSMKNTAQSTNKKRALALAGGSSLYHNNPLTGVSLGYLNNSTKSKEYTRNLNNPKGITSKVASSKENKSDLLVHTTVKVSDYRKLRYELLEAVKRIVRDMDLRVNNCMKALGEAKIVREKSGRVHAHNIMTCGSVWLCPVCSSRISEERREELDRALKNNPDLLPVLVTFTLQHHRGDELRAVLERLNKALLTLKQGYSWVKFQETYKVKAYASSLEITFSNENGWHPHKHILFFLEKDADLEGFERDITARYIKIIDRLGGYASEFHAVDCRSGTAEANSYIAKWGITDEFTKANLKKGRGESLSVWDLALLANSEKWAFMAFREYASATYRKKAITWSKGARELLGIGEEQTDEKIANKEVEVEEEAEVIATLSNKLWNRIVSDAVQEEVFNIADKGGKELLLQYFTLMKYPVRQYGDLILWIN